MNAGTFDMTISRGSDFIQDISTCWNEADDTVSVAFLATREELPDDVVAHEIGSWVDRLETISGWMCQQYREEWHPRMVDVFCRFTFPQEGVSWT